MTEEKRPSSAPEEGSLLKAAGSFIWDLVKILVVALIIIIPFRMFVAEPFVVSGTSMVPNFQNSDYLIIDRLSYKSHGPQRGDVVVFRFPLDTRQFFIKRVIGLPGETVSFGQAGTPNAGHVIITNKDGTKVLNETYLPQQDETFAADVKPVTLGEGEYYVLGDNRTGSSDSRVWGILPKDDIVGKVWLRVIPLGKFGIIPHPQY